MSEFMFLYEHDGKKYASLSSIGTDSVETDKISVIIHPIFFSSYDGNMYSEDATYDKEKGKFVGNKDGSWLDVIYGKEHEIYLVDVSRVLKYDDKYFHCEEDLLDYLRNHGLKYEIIQDVPEYDDTDAHDDPSSLSDGPDSV